MDNDRFFHYMQENIRWRYLDSLDSLRLAQKFNQPKGLARRKTHGETLAFLTILMGHGITVPENQLVDSTVFIPFASEMIDAILATQKTFFAPIRLAWYRSPDPFEIAYKIFNDMGFYLSGWPLLQYDERPRRQDWASDWQSKNVPAEKWLSTSDEDKQAKELGNILLFFQKRSSNMVKAEVTQGLRNKLLGYFIELSEAEMKNLYEEKEFTDRQAITTNDIFQVLKNIKNSRQDFPLDKRSEILKVLDEQKDIAYENVSSLFNQSDIRRGVIKTIDSVYNYSSAVGAKAKQDDSTEEMGKVFETDGIPSENQSQIREWGYEEAAYFLGNWSRQKHVKNIGKTNLNDLVSTHNFNFDEILAEEEYKKALDEFSWKQIISELTSSPWQESVKEYLDSLTEYEDAKEIKGKINRELADEEKQLIDKKGEVYLEKRNKHIQFIKERLIPPNTRINETTDGIDNLRILTANGQVVADANIENYFQDPDELQEKTVLKYSSEKTSNNDVKGIISEL